MTSYLIDINVWLAMTWDMHPQFVSASKWFAEIDESNDSTFLFCRMTMLGFLRLLTNRTVMGDSTATVNAATGLYDRWLLDPRVELAPEPRDIDKPFRRALLPVSLQPATKAIADCYLIAFAKAVDAQIVTFDNGLASMAKEQKVPAALLRALPLKEIKKLQ